MNAKDEKALLYLAGAALQGLLAGTQCRDTADTGFMAANLARATLHYLKNPEAPRPEKKR